MINYTEFCGFTSMWTVEHSGFRPVLLENSIYYCSAYYISKRTITEMSLVKFLTQRLNSYRQLDTHSNYSSAKPLEFKKFCCINFSPTLLKGQFTRTEKLNL